MYGRRAKETCMDRDSRHRREHVMTFVAVRWTIHTSNPCLQGLTGECHDIVVQLSDVCCPVVLSVRYGRDVLSAIINVQTTTLMLGPDCPMSLSAVRCLCPVFCFFSVHLTYFFNFFRLCSSVLSTFLCTHRHIHFFHYTDQRPFSRAQSPNGCSLHAAAHTSL